MNFRHTTTNSNRTQPFSPTEIPTENELNLLSHFDLLSVRDMPNRDAEYFDFSSPSDPAPPSKSISTSTQQNAKCLYCNELFSHDVISVHEAGCFKRRVFCETCAEMIPIEIYDYHVNACSFEIDARHKHHTNENNDFHDFAQSSEGHEAPAEENHENYWDFDDHNDNANGYKEPEYNDSRDHDHDENLSSEDEDKSDEEDEKEDDHDYYSNMYAYQPAPNIPVYFNSNDNHYHESSENDDIPEERYAPANWHQHQEESDHIEDEEPNNQNDLRTYEQLMALDNGIVKKGMSEDEMKKFPVELYLTEVDGDHRCTVCITDYESGETLRRLSCTHRFHKDCIDMWLEHNITCPICKNFLR